MEAVEKIKYERYEYDEDNKCHLESPWLEQLSIFDQYALEHVGSVFAFIRRRFQTD